ncbi:molybdopterin converting factor subunit 1 [Rubinisphaera italica]|nr:molybdopterin converting factor subunit 1 [Rubinisphaera italica]
MNNTSTITIRLFAVLREIVGQDQVTIPWHENLTVAEVKQTLQQTYPEIEPQFKAIMMARNGSYCKQTQLLQPDDEIAFIPPVSGG